MAILLVPLIGGAIWALRLFDRPRLERLMVFLLPLVATLAGGLIASEFLQSFFRGWNDARLAPAAAWLEGYRLYYGVNEGPLLGLMYPPLAALAYLPAVWCGTPEQAVAAGELLTLAYYFAPPLVVLLIEARRTAARWPVTGLCLAAFVLFSGAVRALAGPAFWIHADAPALGLAAVATAIVYFRRQPERAATGIAAALAALLSVLTKQVALPIVVALPLVCLLYDGRRPASRYVLWLLVVGAGLSLLVAGMSDLDALLLNALVLPARHPWIGPALPTLAAAALELLLVSAGPLLVIACSTITVRTDRRESAANMIGWLRGQRWTMWILVAVLMMPTAILGRVKVGGDVNSLAYSLYFLTVAAGLAMLQAASAAANSSRWSFVRLAILPTVTLLLGVTALSPIQAIPGSLALFPTNPERTGFAFARQHPGAVYFPSHPLITLYSERKAHHLSDGVYSRRLAEIEVTQEHIDDYVPRRMEWMVFVGDRDFSTDYLPQFSRRGQVDGLPPYWTVLAREAP